MESNNLASQITKFVGEKHRIVKAEEIYTAFKEEFSDGQIAGVLRRLRTTGRLVIQNVDITKTLCLVMFWQS